MDLSWLALNSMIQVKISAMLKIKEFGYLWFSKKKIPDTCTKTH